MPNVLNELKSLDVDRPSLEELIVLSHAARGIRAEYALYNVNAPAWLDDAQNRLAIEIKARARDVLRLSLRDAELAYDRLKPAETKREEAAARIETLKQQLAAAG